MCCVCCNTHCGYYIVLRVVYYVLCVVYCVSCMVYCVIRVVWSVFYIGYPVLSVCDINYPLCIVYCDVLGHVTHAQIYVGCLDWVDMRGWVLATIMAHQGMHNCPHLASHVGGMVCVVQYTMHNKRAPIHMHNTTYTTHNTTTRNAQHTIHNTQYTIHYTTCIIRNT